MKKELRLDKSKVLNINIFGWLMLTGVFLIAWYYMDNYVMYTLNSDHSSDLVLGHLLSQENAIVTKNWYYSTVLKVIDINVVWAFLFKLTDNWHTVRVLGSVIIYLLMLLCMWYCCRKADMGKCFPFIGAIMLLPISSDYFDIVMRGVYYAATIVTALLTMGLWLSFAKAEKRKTKVWLMIFGSIVSFIGGLCGPMQLVMFNVPMILAAVLLLLMDMDSDKTKVLVFPCIMLVTTLLGYIFSNSVLAKIYDFQVYEEMLFTQISNTRIEEFINSWLEVFGYVTGQSIFSKALIVNAVAGIWILLSFYCAIYVLFKREQYSMPRRAIAALFLCYFVVMLLVFNMSSKGILTRYLVLGVVFSTMAIFACFGEGYVRPKVGKGVLAAFVAAALLCGALNYNDLRKTDDTKGQREAAQALVEQGYTQGYATFWNANVLTELSNGQLEMWHWNDGKQSIETLEDFNDIYPWLQAKSHLDSAPQGKFFVLLSANEDYYFEFTNNFSDEYVVYRADNYYDYGYNDYIAYGFESYEQLAELLSK